MRSHNSKRRECFMKGGVINYIMGRLQAGVGLEIGFGEWIEFIKTKFNLKHSD